MGLAIPPYALIPRQCLGLFSSDPIPSSQMQGGKPPPAATLAEAGSNAIATLDFRRKEDARAHVSGMSCKARKGVSERRVALTSTIVYITSLRYRPRSASPRCQLRLALHIYHTQYQSTPLQRNHGLQEPTKGSSHRAHQ